MLYCNLQVLFCTEIAVEKHFDPRNVTSGGASKKFLGSLSLAMFYGPLINYAVIRPLASWPTSDITKFITHKNTYNKNNKNKQQKVQNT